MRSRYRGFLTLNMARPKTRQRFVFLFLAAAVLFSFVGALAMVQAEQSLTGSDLSRVTSHLSPQTLSMIVGESIPYFQEKIQTAGLEEIISRTAFELMTSIDFRDPRTFLGKELPLYALFDSEIDVASSDVDYTSIPIESPPPPDLDKQIMKAMEHPDEDKTSTDPGSIKTKQVIIYNTHFWESFLPELHKTNPDQATDLNRNITLVSKHLAKQLEKMGIGAVTTERKYTWNSGAYVQSRKMVLSVLKQYHSISYMIDIHRDSRRRDKTTKVFDGKPYARLAFVVGKASTHFEDNLSLAREMHKRINELYPGLSRAVIIKERGNGNNGEYNQSLSPNSMLVEVGGVDNSFAEANRSIEVLARVLADIIHEGTVVTARPDATEAGK
ncbi:MULTISPECIES: stage II sporulation protein P [Thermoactinomyces]|jgi:stage II sporulation protein P|uniref:Stage II sporulation protein P n=1 Tax=Thermoactinomyces daqus TaxID=1329516 RepID=A0A7W2AHF8_9BACL|nr:MULTISPECIES: stage II sporulation protein P [Thermoactinomyces]MBA4542656.1 stage II sporulation protein P [Thermoactinomyces daqus]MBH8597364.1 stage II sporulation protein P [Thermoactinomyces sp. CICC 10523]MBH8602925.1 stage II sporulation protein P [Thermoactinomyces sp. CICC 10522]MBH8607227.1 stage II sporulation protein P [Thermoactinomyces sp. CICC 10521]